MPTYVYKFVETGETIEVQQAFTDDALTEAVHPATGTMMTVKKVFQPVGVTFKGGGFYKTDSRGGSAKTSAAASTTPASSDGATNGSTGSTPSSSESTSSTNSSSTPAPAPATTSSPAS